jgi:hypothetical protein
MAARGNLPALVLGKIGGLVPASVHDFSIEEDLFLPKLWYFSDLSGFTRSE